MDKKKLTTFLVCLLILLGGSFSSTAQADLYSQSSIFPNGNLYSSENDTAGVYGNFSTVYDNFTLTDTSTITDVHWQGGYFPVTNMDTLESFTISFHYDNAGEPGALFYSETIAGSANETFVGLDSSSDQVYDYSVDLITSLPITGGTQYWMSIVANMPFPPNWGWQEGTGGDGVGYQDYFGDRLSTSDLAFALTGTSATTVPEPSTFLLLGAGLAGVGLLRKKFKS